MLKMLRYTLFILSWFACSHGTAYGDFLTPEAWDSTSNTFTEGRLKYRQFNIPVAPGIKDSASASKYLLIDSGENFLDTVVKAPDTMVTIYVSGIVGNFVQYKGMVSDNWNFAKLSQGDFSDAAEAYALEGNWGIIQSTYYVLKGSSRVVWAVAILNSGEALFQMAKAVGQTAYYLVRYPVTGVIEVAAAPVVLVGGTAWSTAAAGVTTGWALPVTATIDGVKYVGESVWPK
ncbi:MAG: hypothetical protein HGB32_03025 [Geobacteraceae bacterium]|nr:hypothetical protein [Geobacteraceae bacterium]NTW79106.1 hypothetical protein [Geobacteraceae bacterium]